MYDFKHIEDFIAQFAPEVKGKIATADNKLNPLVTLTDITNALTLIKEAQATLDDIGPPGNNSGTPIQQMFISQDDANVNEWNPETHQNQGRLLNPSPKKIDEKKPEKPKVIGDISDRMEKLMELIDQLDEKNLQ